MDLNYLLGNMMEIRAKYGYRTCGKGKARDKCLVTGWRCVRIGRKGKRGIHQVVGRSNVRKVVLRQVKNQRKVDS